MRTKLLFGLWLCLALCAQAAVAADPALEIRTLKPGATLTVDRLIGDDKALISVSDAGRQPLLGLGGPDFAVRRGVRNATVTAVQPLAESLDVPRHLVLVLDNSDSMRQRHAVEALLAGVDEILKIVRPIDRVHLVVFDSRQATKMAGRDLHVRTFSSNRPAELRDYVAGVYRDGMTPTTVLYEAMLAGLEIIRTLPADEPRFMVVFSDGEDINSAYKREEVSRAAQGLARFDAYAIDYMPGQTTDRFLAEFAAGTHGQIWKATSETNLVPIFQSVASKMQYYYVVSYLFPPTGSLVTTPATLTVDELQAGSGPVAGRLDAAALAVHPVIDSAYGVAGWQLAVSNAGGRVAELAGSGAPAAELAVPLAAVDALQLAAGGSLQVTMTVQDRKGQELVLTAPPVRVTVFRTAGSLAVAPASVSIEEIRTIDASPMLGHVYFAEGSGEIPAQYLRFAAPDETAGFDEQKFRDTLEKYYQVLNIVGKRLADNPEATITLVGCNADTGAEKGKKKLSALRAEAVRAYLQAIWNIAPERIATEVRNLPEIPSTSRSKEGQAENRRVEIRSNDPAILDLVRSTYFTNRIDAPALDLSPLVMAPHGIARWKVTTANAAGPLSEIGGEGAPAPRLTAPLPTGDLNDLAAGGDITVTMELQDRKGQTLALSPEPVKVNFIRTSQRLAEKQGLRVQEKYALILFDFDKDTIDARNQAIVDAITARLHELPQATVEVVGHTDNIGKEAYNLKLSERRALAVYKLLAAAYGEDPGERIRYRGVGPGEPLYDNLSPEARSFNRTVTITLEYLAAE